MAQSWYCRGTCSEGLNKKKTKLPSQDGRCTGRDSKRAPPKYATRALYLASNGTRVASEGVGNAQVPWHPNGIALRDSSGSGLKHLTERPDTQTMCDCPDASLPKNVQSNGLGADTSSRRHDLHTSQPHCLTLRTLREPHISRRKSRMT